MNTDLILLHEEALRATHPVFNAAAVGTKAIYVWDDAYFRATRYTLKRLIFIYETLSELPIDIIKGDTLSVIQQFEPTKLYMPATNNPLILSTLEPIKSIVNFEFVVDEPFVTLKYPTEFRRFFQYWNKAEKLAFLNNGGINA